jgi:hypothetical protein
MNDLEASARSPVTALVKGETFTLSTEQVAIVATWAAKTALMAEFTHPESNATPAEHYRQLYETRLPPPGMHVWAAPIDAEDWALRMQHLGVLYGDPRETDIIQPCNTHSTTIGLGRVVFCVMGTTNPAVEFPHLDEIPPFGAIRVWPAAGPHRWSWSSPLDERAVW